MKRPIFWILILIVVAIVFYSYTKRQHADQSTPAATTTQTIADSAENTNNSAEDGATA